MFNVTKTELKKMVSRPGIYILSLLLAIILVLGIFIYKPDNYKLSSATLVGKNFQEKLEYFNDGDKKKTDESISTIISSVLLYDTSASSYKEQVGTQKNALNESYTDFKKSRVLGEDYSIQNSFRVEVLTHLESLNTTITQGINNAQQEAYTIISTEENYKKYEKLYTSLKEYLSLEITSEETLNSIIDAFDKNKSNYYATINNLYYPTIAENTFNNFTQNKEGTSLYIVRKRLNEIQLEITNLSNEIATGNTELNAQQQVEKLTDLANKYVWTGETYVKYVNHTLMSSAFKEADSQDKRNLMFLKDTDEYNTNSNLIKFEYLFKNNKYEASYANPLTIGVSSNQETNAFDYAYFAMKLFGIVIIIYAIIHACSTISGEIKDGSLRYFAMRPIKRNELLFGKMIATLIMSLILIIFSGIISTLVGGAVYGFNSTDILTVFSSSKALVIKPVVMIIIYMLSLFIELFVYVSIAYLLSCLFKSDLLCATMVIVLFLINSLLPAFVSGANSWLAFYPFSHVSLYSLFGSNMYASTDNFFNLVFGAKIFVTTSIIYTILVPALSIVICSIISTYIFNKKEL